MSICWRGGVNSLLMVPLTLCDSKQTLVGNQFSQSRYNKSHVVAVMGVLWSVECIECTIIEVRPGSIFSWLWLRRLSPAAGARLHCTGGSVGPTLWDTRKCGSTGHSVVVQVVVCSYRWWCGGHVVMCYTECTIVYSE